MKDRLVETEGEATHCAMSFLVRNLGVNLQAPLFLAIEGGDNIDTEGASLILGWPTTLLDSEKPHNVPVDRKVLMYVWFATLLWPPQDFICAQPCDVITPVTR